MDTKGIETVRRDNCRLVQNVIETSLRKLLIDRDVLGAQEYVSFIISAYHSFPFTFTSVSVFFIQVTIVNLYRAQVRQRHHIRPPSEQDRHVQTRHH